MLHVSNVSKRYGETLLFEGVSFDLNPGDRVGLVGPNGCGKTTLLRILMGLETPDVGSVRWDPGAEPGYLPQALPIEPEATVQDALRGNRVGPEHWAEQVQALAMRLASAKGAERGRVERAYHQALERLTQAAKALPEHVQAQVLAGLGLEDVSPETPLPILSGGQRTRLGLARLLLQNPSLLLLDEPTNHLDIAALEWLEEYLHAYRGAMLIVSHDRAFLNRTVKQILEIDPPSHKVIMYMGNYDAYALTKAQEREKHRQAYKEQQERIARLEGAISQLKGHARGIERETIHYHYRKVAKKVARQATVRQKRLERLLSSEECVEKPKLNWEMKLEFVNTPPSGQDVLILEGLGKRFGERVLFEDVNLILLRGERVAFLGANGSGKTTLLRIIMGLEEPSQGSCRLGANVKAGYLAQDQDNLDENATVLETVRHQTSLSETDARGFLHFFLFQGDEVFTRVGQLSFGERARLALGTLVLQGCNLLLLDEPINHLDIPSRERFEDALRQFEGTVVAVVHDRYFVERFATSIWSLEERTVHRYVDLADARRRGANEP
ncbi:MAG: ABC-F family ATP-binding cassette domain-containing protein [Chloroflexi bacterium]|nr:ABC-F family ATP-binding cassette domain-containing protein [Chloroflexota bacterium]